MPARLKTLTETVLDEIEEFLVQRDLTATKFGQMAANDGHLVFRLRNKDQQSITSARIDTVRAFMRDYRPHAAKPRKSNRAPASTSRRNRSQVV